MKKEKKKKIIQKLKNRYRLIIYNDSTFQTVWSTKLTRMNVFVIGGMGSLLLIFLTVLIIAYTPIREFIPGYPSGDVRDLIVRNAIMVDSLEQQLHLRDNYFDKIKLLVEGGVPEEPDYMADTMERPVEVAMHAYNHDSVFRQNLLEEQLGLSLQQSETKQTSLAQVHFFTPLKGLVSQKFDKNIDHFAVDIVGLPNARISAVLAGTVVFAGWTVETGYVIYLQHDNNLISVYKHNSELLKKVGEQVQAGEVIAFMGNTGELTTGPHLHFELWHKGTPLDPMQYIDF
ncbi:M23 family metallopeptidase [Gaoshiqia sediminis]|uniref:M23 family metallopeptidase n=1 Tax=Gaoshiqia sediminis TaxID=2986998 RepID=A0AA42CA75_9BACT|nr:M23 family metallopeptidase [Gaoshiqia sediminis]MCW0483125.1 M23 family metallopeptidase [Gaoshiqia sediminis]